MSKSYPSLVLMLILIFVTMRAISGVLDWWNFEDPQIKLESRIEQRSILVQTIPNCALVGQAVQFRILNTGEIVYFCGGAK